jgi:O-antigen/teichoic acid export membrane protein
VKHAPKTDALGGGGLWLGVAKLWFLVASYAISISLTHLLPAETWGRYYVVARLIAVPNMVIIYTLLFSVSRPLAAQYEKGFPAYDGLRRRGVQMALVLGGIASLVFFAGAPLFSTLLTDPALTMPIRVVAPISLVYALYAVNLGTINAVRRFRRQAALDIAMATMKSGFIIAAAAAGLGLAATVGGFTLASVAALCLSIALVVGVRPSTAGSEAPRASVASFAGVLIVFTAVVNLLQSADVLLLKGFAQTHAQDEAVGFYASAQQVALVPYSLMNAMALLVFPLIASIDQQREPERVRAYLSQTARVTVLLLAFMSCVGSASAADIQALLFPDAYGTAARELRLLVWGFSGYSFAVTTAWVFNSAKRSRMAVLLVACPLVVVVVVALGLVPRSFTGGAAVAVAAAGGVATVVGLGMLRRTFGAAVPLAHLLKLAAAVSAVELVAYLWPAISTAGLGGKLAILAKLVVLSVVFVFVVAVTRGVTKSELKELRRAR